MIGHHGHYDSSLHSDISARIGCAPENGKKTSELTDPTNHEQIGFR
ncbi:hypothetical protein HMPREF0742_00513 [Rothia aeria F0184]|uniref:Uncharacterized protein n=1 Tax=Rothia aeria F0184 TaxID=888019 RepID=U7V5W9_9MICC|nr:hypothetical protein HMPREF0742_00513 [Rothia aeria F0184]